jgi:hypothetical protein
MRPALLGLLVLSIVTAVACGGGEPADTGLPEAVGDTQLVKEAQAVANDLIRNASDCSAVEASYADVVAKLDEVEGKLVSEVGRSTLATIRTQVKNVTDACGVR